MNNSNIMSLAEFNDGKQDCVSIPKKQYLELIKILDDIHYIDSIYFLELFLGQQYCKMGSLEDYAFRKLKTDLEKLKGFMNK